MERTFEQLINTNTRIAVLAGGMSNEREVSLRSGKNCLAALQRLGYKNSILIDVDENIVQNLKNEKIDGAIAVIIGAEGGFSAREADYIIEAGAKSVSLGKRILRCETAPTFVLSCIAYETEM